MGKKVLLAVSALIFTFVLGISGYLLIIYAGDYVVDEKKLVMNSATTLVDENGDFITKLFLENREPVSIQDIPEYVQNAFIAVEDNRFYEHHGVDIRAIVRALYKDIVAGEKVEGGSTITQQLAKNVFLTNEKTWLRKTKELIIAINLENKYSKQKLLEMYVNQIYFGHGAYGVQAASKLYFNKNVSELTVEEGALLAAIPKSPTNYSPLLNPDKSKERRDLVINLMEERDFIEAEEAVRYQGKTLSLNVNRLSKEPGLLAYIDMVFSEAKDNYSLSNEELLKGGYTITVPMNRSIQQTAYELFQDTTYFPGTDEQAQGAYVLMDSTTGGVLAFMGGRDYVRKGLNRGIVKRQPGSTMKPLAVYGPALEEGKFEPYSLLIDKKLSYGDYEPENYNNVYKDKITMYDAIKESSNAPAVWTLNYLGIETGKKYLADLGISIPDRGLAIALGGLEEGASPLQMTKAYSSFARDGQTVEPYFITKIENRNQRVIATASPEVKQVFSKQTAWYMTRMLEAVVKAGTAQSGVYNGALAGKTGTTSYPGVAGAVKDAWFVGYTPNVVGALWMGYDRTDANHYLTKGSSLPTTLFKKILQEVEVEKTTAFHPPEGVSELDPPIRLKKVTDLFAKLSFKPMGLFTITLKWTPSEDDRIQYRIYANEKDKWSFIDSVTGKGEFQLENVNIFSLPSFYVVPFNPQTDQAGQRSNIADSEFFTSKK